MTKLESLKKNSLLGTKTKQEQENIKTFSNKIRVGKKSCSLDKSSSCLLPTKNIFLKPKFGIKAKILK